MKGVMEVLNFSYIHFPDGSLSGVMRLLLCQVLLWKPFHTHVYVWNKLARGYVNTCMYMYLFLLAICLCQSLISDYLQLKG